MTTSEIGPRKKPRLTEEQVTEIMRLKREGRSISDIARAIGCHRQTVRMHLREKHGDIVAEEVRKQVLIEELRSHFQELVNFALVGFKWRLRASRAEIPGLTGLEVPTLGPISVAGVLGLPGPGSSKYACHEWIRMYYPSSRDNHLMQALREHTRDSDVWAHWDGWRREVADYETASRQLLEWIASKTEPERWQKIDPEHMESVQWWLFGNIILKTGGGEYEKVEIRGPEIATPGAREVVARARDGAASKLLYDWLWAILREAETLSEWAALEAATRELKEVEKQKKLMGIVVKMDSALDGIGLMRAFPGRCHLCPV